MYWYKTILGRAYIAVRKAFQILYSQELYFVLTAIPALRPVVFDLFLLRGGNKPDISRDLETQREVVVSMLLRLIQYYQVRLHYM